MPRFALLFISVAAAVLSGCATVEEQPAPVNKPLVEAPSRTLVTCVSTKPLSAQDPFESLIFPCEQLETTAPLSEITDAGWRLESVSVGKESNLNGVISMPLTITIRKLF